MTDKRDRESGEEHSQRESPEITELRNNFDALEKKLELELSDLSEEDEHKAGLETYKQMVEKALKDINNWEKKTPDIGDLEEILIQIQDYITPKKPDIMKVAKKEPPVKPRQVHLKLDSSIAERFRRITPKMPEIVNMAEVSKAGVQNKIGETIFRINDRLLIESNGQFRMFLINRREQLLGLQEKLSQGRGEAVDSELLNKINFTIDDVKKLIKE